ncbi:MAG: chromosomal replication initiator protein DnaA [Lachnospiraceae bacterium]|nr:chromosomal replication initiator protein DnaA [Lachnospiraceae bacterium]
MTQYADKELTDLFHSILDEFREKEKISDAAMGLWFSDAEIKYLTDELAVIVTPNNFKRDIIKKRFCVGLTAAFREVTGLDLKLDIRSSEQLGSETFNLNPPTEEELNALEENKKNPVRIEPEDTPFSTESKEIAYYSTAEHRTQTAAAPKEPEERDDRTQKNGNSPDYTFENFVVGNSNKFAQAACYAVANEPARQYNPLFIYGPSGLGKTHLLYAIANYIMEKHPSLEIVYVKGDEFTNQLIDAISKNATPAFRERYRMCDVLLIDDIQFIAGRTSTQEEFFHTFNELYESKKQIIMTSDRPPREITTLEERLKTRFEWGLTADIKPPDSELRIAILKSKAEALGLTLDNDCLRFLSDGLRSNVRQLEGAVRKISAQVFLTGMNPSLPMIRACVADIIDPPESTKLTADNIINTVAAYYDVKPEFLRSKKRDAIYAQPRHVAVYLIRVHTSMSFPAIGKIFQRNHTTVMSSYEVICKELRNNPAMEIAIKELEKRIME